MTNLMNDTIRVKGARVNNLKNVTLDIPRNKLIVLTGLSGSGKSSLAFDTLYAPKFMSTCVCFTLVLATPFRL